MAFGFSEAKFKAQLKMAIKRIELVNNKIENDVKRLKREIAGLLNKPQKEEEKAKIKCEHLIRGDHTIAAHSILELMCEALIARVKLVSQTKQCPVDLLQAVSTIIYCSARVDIPELKKLKKMFSIKYKKSFVQRALNNVDYHVNTTVLKKLTIANPKAGMVRNYLKSIADEYGFAWEPQEEVDPMTMSAAPVGNDINPAAATGFTQQYGPDGAPIIYGYPNGLGENVAVSSNDNFSGAGPRMLPGPPQFAQMDNPARPHHATQPAQQVQPAQPTQFQPNTNLMGTFGVNPNVSSERLTPPHVSSATSARAGNDKCMCPTCGSLVDSSKLRGASVSVMQDALPPAPRDFGKPTQPVTNSTPRFGMQSAADLLPPAPPDGEISAHMEQGSHPRSNNSQPTSMADPSNELSPPPPAGNTVSADFDFMPPPPPPARNTEASSSGDAPDMDELEARFRNLLE